ncbi:hypothetical protein TTHERM_001494742, partial (macronuclear) [Tetrahymena thermophila SB210]
VEFQYQQFKNNQLFQIVNQIELVINLLRIQLINTAYLNRQVNFIQNVCYRRLKAQLKQQKVINDLNNNYYFLIYPKIIQKLSNINNLQK